MLVGIMSDSHGNAAATAQAVALLKKRGATKLFHCGDICGEAVLDELAGHDCSFVWGNCDRPPPSPPRYVASLGLTWPEGPVRLEVVGKRIAVYHGHEADLRAAVLERGLDYVFHGHSHEYDHYSENGCHVINPGAISRAGMRTVALLEMETGDVSFLRIDTGREVAAHR